MINVSNEFKQLMNIRTDFKENAEVTFADGTFLKLSEKDFTISNNSLADAAESNGIPLGVAVCRNVQIELMNDDDRFSDYDFFGAVIRLYLAFQLSETVERIEYGTFTVLTPQTYGETIIVTALDDMYKADKAYSTSLTFPATLGEMMIDACGSIGISLGSATFSNHDFVVQSAPKDITYRQLFGYISMIAGGNARIDRTGRLQIISYDFTGMSSVYGTIINGGKFNPWNNPSDVYGGTFDPWDEGDDVSGGRFGDRANTHVLTRWSSSPQVDTDDITITGIQTSRTDADNNEEILLYGAEGYVLQVKNPLFEGREEEALALIGSVMVNGSFRQFSGDLVADPTIEFMDSVLVLDRKGNVYSSFVTDITFQFFGFTSIKNSAAPVIRNNSSYASDANNTLVAARKMVEKERTAREKAVEQLAKDLANSSGLFATEEVQPDGSAIYYMHDKPTLEESMIVWKLTALAFGISTDGGKTYPYGFTINGEIIANLLYANGIDATYIIAETITADKIKPNSITANQIDANSVSAELIKTQIFEAEWARILSLETKTANIETLVTENFTAVYGDIETIKNTYLETKDLAAEVAKFGYVTTDELNAVSATVGTIYADYVKASTLGDDVVTAITGKAVYVASLNTSGILNANGGLTVNGYDVGRKTATIGGVTINYWGWD